MDEKTKAELDQIMDMISIYQSSIDGSDVETMKLIEIDLNKKKQQLLEIQERLNGELSKLYNNGGNEIDRPINLLQHVIKEIDNALENISDILGENTNIEVVSEDKVIEGKIEGLDDFVPEDGESTVIDDLEKLEEMPEEISEFTFDNKTVNEEKDIQDDIFESAKKETEEIKENLDDEEVELFQVEQSSSVKELEVLEVEQNFLEEELETVETEQSSIEEELKPIEEEQNIVAEEVDFIENKSNITSDSLIVQLGEPSSKYRKIAENIVNSRNSDDEKDAEKKSLIKYLAARGIIMNGCQEALSGNDKKQETQNINMQEHDEKITNYDKDERIR